ncbi:alpha/beta fold hydrolase [Gordonia amarae]|uniref:Alpha/beta fold hydrolase n=2 Tax=Gordonia amarae TaxID=36821 RepID=A0A857LPT0_9ACTN|nr:alpha/beta hydrolase [Gordonia amarae]MCS3877436.1 pimeloyl-ACP methyl ester carboxylesterase [Gordonia amarae]QHN16177.1 alpha/beta fold hydrolase [Gordonia amarae]QHN20746.1 alpha/beta fold hydrolase [Gordonia amarae]QHN29597.1 alpha/beta fold hydrolase [Gordonia amarae]QHN38373.1 alpha/beta fold hydrolase [Gordonia amarae]
MPTDPNVAAPQWFTDAISTPGERHSLEVDGATIVYRTWGDAGAPGVLLVHGGGAHGGWWDHLAPQLAAGRRVVALDLSGHGDSDWRETYTFDTWARELHAVAVAARADHRLLVVGHSLGGVTTATASRLFPELITDIVMIDSEVYDPAVHGTSRPGGDDQPSIRSTGRRHYPSRDELLARYRLVPDHPCLGYAKDYVAAGSVVSEPEGWRWKFDRTFALHLDPRPPMPAPDTRVTVIRAGRGRMTSYMAGKIVAELRTVSRIVTFPEAGHHVMLDYPLELLAEIREAIGRLPG